MNLALIRVDLDLEFGLELLVLDSGLVFIGLDLVNLNQTKSEALKK